MNSQRRQVGRRFLCVLVAALVSLLLVVLPFAQTLDASDSGRDSGTPDFQYEDADIIVTANLSGDTKIPADAEFCVEPITQDTDSEAYKNVETQVNKDVTADHQTVTGFRAYDIYFSANGTRYEPEAGDATVTIQYKDRVFDSAVKKATDEIKVLHLKDSGGKTKVEDVTKAVDVKDLGGSKAKKANSSSEAVAKDNGKDGSENLDGDTVQFVTKSFSTFVVAGITSTGTLNVTMTFNDAKGAVNPNIKGVYYLCLFGTYKGTPGYRYTLTLNVNKGISQTVQLTGLYDASGNGMAGGLPYPLLNSSSSPTTAYTAQLFQFSGLSTINPNFLWNAAQDTPANGYTAYENGSYSADNFLISYPTSVQIDTSKTGTLAIIATAGSQVSSAYLQSALAPVEPYGVYADTADIREMDACVAVNQATIHANFGYNPPKDNSSYISTFTVYKTYKGKGKKTFTFSLNKQDQPPQKGYITLPTANGSINGTYTFTVNGPAAGYTVSELDSNGKPMKENDTDAAGGFTLQSVDHTANTVMSTANTTSYINTVLAPYPAEPLKNNNTLCLGQGYKVVQNYQNSGREELFAGTQDTTMFAVTSKNDHFKAPSDMPDFSGTLGKMEMLSKQLAALQPPTPNDLKYADSSDTLQTFDLSDTVKAAKPMTVDQWVNYKQAHKTEFVQISPGDKMLLLNFGVPDGITSIDFGGNTKLKVNGIQAGDWYAGANNIVVNIYTVDSKGNYLRPYSGNIALGYLMGTLLAPRATVTGLCVNYCGTIVAHSVDNNGAEVHGSNMGVTTTDTVYTFVNTDNTSTPYTLPETGGGGTAIFYTTGGAVLLFGAVLAYVYRLSGKRRHIRKRRHKSPNE